MERMKSDFSFNKSLIQIGFQILKNEHAQSDSKKPVQNFHSSIKVYKHTHIQL